MTSVAPGGKYPTLKEVSDNLRSRMEKRRAASIEPASAGYSIRVSSPEEEDEFKLLEQRLKQS